MKIFFNGKRPYQPLGRTGADEIIIPSQIFSQFFQKIRISHNKSIDKTQRKAYIWTMKNLKKDNQFNELKLTSNSLNSGKVEKSLQSIIAYRFKCCFKYFQSEIIYFQSEIFGLISEIFLTLRNRKSGLV